MRFAIVSDIHGNLQALEAVLSDLRTQNFDTILCLGDIVGYGPNPNEALNRIRQHCRNFVLGNHDAVLSGRLDPVIFNQVAREAIDWTMEQVDSEAKDFLSTIPLRMTYGDMLCVHAVVHDPESWTYIESSDDASLSFDSTDARLIFIGHSHIPEVYVQSPESGMITHAPPENRILLPGERYIINVGSVGDPRDGDLRACYGLYDDQTGLLSFRRVAFDQDSYRDALESTGLTCYPLFLALSDQPPPDPIRPGASRPNIRPHKGRRSLVFLCLLFAMFVLGATGFHFLHIQKNTERHSTSPPSVVYQNTAPLHTSTSPVVQVKIATPLPTRRPTERKKNALRQRSTAIPIRQARPTRVPTPRSVPAPPHLPLRDTEDMILAYEGFEIFPDRARTLDGGVGWKDLWTEGEKARGHTIMPGSLLPSATSIPLASTGGHLCQFMPSSLARALDTGPNSAFSRYGYLDGNSNIGKSEKTLYISFLQQVDAPEQQWKFSIHRDRSGDDGCLVGIGNNEPGGPIHLQDKGEHNLLICEKTTGVHSFVVRIRFKEGNDDLRVYHNPPVGPEPEKAAIDVMDFKALSFDRISLTYLSGPGRVFHDEIRVGTSYNAVTSHRLPWGMTASWANLDVIPSAVYLSMKEGNWNTAAACLKRRVPMHPDLSPFQESANLLENVTASILQSFHSDIGNTIEICLRNKARPQLRVAAVNAGHILCVHEREDRDVLHQLRPEDLHITEQLKRLGGPRSMTAHLYHATLLLHNGNMRAAALSFSRMNTPLGNGLAQLATAEYDAALVASLIRTLAQHGFLNNAHTEATARSVLERETFSRAQRANLQAVVVRFQQQHPDAPQRTKALLTELKRSIEL